MLIIARTKVDGKCWVGNVSVIDKRAIEFGGVEGEVFCDGKQYAVFQQQGGRGRIGHVVRVDLDPLADRRFGDGGDQLGGARAFKQTRDQVAAQLDVADGDFVQAQQR